MIELRDVTIRSGSFELKSVSLEIPRGAYAVLMGQTGQGKTTILEAICGLRRIVAGKILMDGVDVTHWKPARRGIGYVPQDLALFPTMSVSEHLEFALRLRRLGSSEIQSRIKDLSSVLGIEHLLSRGVRHLSGGEAQRVALGRALAFRPRVLLLDEPLTALDEATRDRLCDLLRLIQRRDDLTTLHITHNRIEAQLLADRLFQLRDRQIGEYPLSEIATQGSASVPIGSVTS